MAKKRQTKAEKQLEAAIEQAYYRLAQGKTIDIMLIGKLYDDCRTAVTAGTALDDAMNAAIAKYCQAA
jgi:hypothetical protein